MAAVGVIVLHVVAGMAMWFGAATSGAPLTIGAALAGALNSMPIAGLALGASAFALGWLPSGVVAVGAMPGAGGFLLNVITQSFRAPEWLANLSPFAHLGAVPNAAPDWAGIGAFTAIDVVSFAVSVKGFANRDMTA